MSGFEARALGFRYGQQSPLALQNINLSLPSGSVTWITGAPGAGTSTLLLAACGLAPLHTGGVVSGSCRLLGEDPQTPEGRKLLNGRVAYVSADPASQLSGIEDTVRCEVAFAPANLGWPRERIDQATEQAMHRMEISHLAARVPASLSGGEQQRVVMASMLALTPDVWLLDEPGSALDARGRGMLAAALVAEARRGALVAIASEDADWLAGFADRLIVMAGGSMVRDGVPAELLADPTLAQTGAGSTAVATLARALAAHDSAFDTSHYPITVAAALERWA